MTTLLKPYLTVLIAFLAIDAVWIGAVVSTYYRQELGNLMLESSNFVAAAVFYLFYAAGIVLLAVTPAVKAGRMHIALINGAVLGALAYGTYTVTNYAILHRWSLGLVGSDILWGASLTAATASLGYWAAART